MKAVQFDEYGDPDVLHVSEVDEPHAGPGQVRIKVAAAGVNAIDWKLRSGHMREQMPLDFPAGTGLDASGVVDEVGDVISLDAGSQIDNPPHLGSEGAKITAVHRLPDAILPVLDLDWVFAFGDR